MGKTESIIQAYQLARDQYETIGVDVDSALDKLNSVEISLHCWQTDDVGGFETPDAALGGGGIAVTGNYPGKARTILEMRTGPGEGDGHASRKTATQFTCQLW